MRVVKFGVLYLPTYVPELDGPEATFYAHMLEQIELADELGYETVWLTEHHFDVYGGTVPNPAVLGALVAARTSRIRIGTAVTVLPLHNPLIVAEDFAMLDVISGGRLDFGIGRGSVQREAEEFGLTDTSAALTAEAIQLITRLWHDRQVDHDGAYFHVRGIGLRPRPVQQPHPPIWVGASRTRDTFAWAGRQGFHVMVLPYMMPAADLKERLHIYYEAACEAGRDTSRLEVMAKFHVFVADSTEEASRIAGPAYDRYQQIASSRTGHGRASWRPGSSWDEHRAENKVIGGTPGDCIERVRYWQEALGITHIGGTFHFGGLEQSATLRSLELFAREVAPAFTPLRTPGRRAPFAGVAE
jgi:natural product biosynthesis luciferase-like monooxygenase protein